MPDSFAKYVVGYADPLSVCAGQSLDVCVSCDSPGPFTASLVRIVSADARPHGTGYREVAIDADFAGSYDGETQTTTPGSYTELATLPRFDALTFACKFFPTLLETAPQTLVHGGNVRIDVDVDGVTVHVGARRVDMPASLRERRWHRLVVSIGAHVAAHLDRAACAQTGPALECTARGAVQGLATDGVWELARAGAGQGHFNGRLEAVRLYDRALDAESALDDLDAPAPQHAPFAAWDFALAVETSRIVDISGNGRDGTLHQTPTRAVRGARWRGDVFNWREAPRQYAAIHFHDDDLTDAGWRPSIRWRIPDDLPSGVYAVKLECRGTEDHVVFFVRPAPHHHRARIAYLASTATYLAYANQRLGFRDGVYVKRAPRDANDAYLLAHPGLGSSLYDCHRDGSGVHYSSRLRPILNLKPKCIPWAFTADANLTAWLERTDERFDVITDEDLHRDGAAALEPYAVVVTGAHPEYHSTRMLDGLTEWLATGGRLMYMGGNGFYWRIAHDPENPAIIEVRRAEDGTRAWIAEPGEYYHSFTGEYGGLWRRLGRPPNALVGIGFAAQGFDGGTHYRFTAAARDPRVAFIVDGVDLDRLFGRHGTQGGGAAGEEIDRYDESLGSPLHALVIARSEDHKPGMLRVKEEFLMMRPLGNDPDVRADMTFFETVAGGAVFSTGSISYAGALSTNDYHNDVARLTGNVLRRFVDPTPFAYPTDTGS
ncbi:MAG TPA: N,N-dimethylformamidase beta subunit family domain-containing protein [Pseudomonadales bacterium]|nr:N,N-dimethylformamidase beta subunit family domain-containing protein [Pseudomonadales bacterium]